MDGHCQMLVLAGTPKGMYFETHLINYCVYYKKNKKGLKDNYTSADQLMIVTKTKQCLY
jgi:hypothetical protein